MKQKKNINEMNVKELQTYIRKLTNKSNKTLEKISSRKKVSRAVQEELNVLKNKNIIGKKGKAVLGFRGKSKEQLKAQARELEYFGQWKGKETTAVRNQTDKKKYETFIKNNPEFKDYNYQEWRDMVEMFGITQNFIESFGYENIKQLHNEATAKDTTFNLADEMQKVIKEKKGLGLSQEDFIDVLRGKLFK